MVTSQITSEALSDGMKTAAARYGEDGDTVRFLFAYYARFVAGLVVTAAGR